MTGWRDWGAGQWMLRLVVFLGPVAAVLVRGLAADLPPAWLVLLVVLLSAGWALAPESMVGAAVLLVAGFTWASGLKHGLPASVLLAAAAMLSAHVAAVLVSYGPPRLPVGSSMVRLWWRRAGLLFLAAPLVWLVGRAVARLPDGTSVAEVWVAGLVVAVSVTVVGAAAVQAALPRDD